MKVLKATSFSHQWCAAVRRIVRSAMTSTTTAQRDDVPIQAVLKKTVVRMQIFAIGRRRDIARYFLLKQYCYTFLIIFYKSQIVLFNCAHITKRHFFFNQQFCTFKYMQILLSLYCINFQKKYIVVSLFYLIIHHY